MANDESLLSKTMYLASERRGAPFAGVATKYGRNGTVFTATSVGVSVEVSINIMQVKGLESYIVLELLIGYMCNMELVKCMLILLFQ